jgi:hypothetical protein
LGSRGNLSIDGAKEVDILWLVILFANKCTLYRFFSNPLTYIKKKNYFLFQSVLKLLVVVVEQNMLPPSGHESDTD